MRHKKYLHDGLDLERLKVVKIIPHDKDRAFIILRSIEWGEDYWCLEFWGNTRYFDNVDEMKAYFEYRFKKVLPPIPDQ